MWCTKPKETNDGLNQLVSPKQVALTRPGCPLSQGAVGRTVFTAPWVECGCGFPTGAAGTGGWGGAEAAAGEERAGWWSGDSGEEWRGKGGLSSSSRELRWCDRKKKAASGCPHYKPVGKHPCTTQNLPAQLCVLNPDSVLHVLRFSSHVKYEW